APQRAKAGVRVGQMMKDAGADDVVEHLVELARLFDREPVEIEVCKPVFALQLACVAEACLADVDSCHMRVGLAHRVSGGLRGPAARDPNLPARPRLLCCPHEKRQRAAALRILIKLAMLVETAKRGRIGMTLVKYAHLVGPDPT